MTRWHVVSLAATLALAGAVASGRAKPASDEKPNFSGSWTLNVDLSDSPASVGFGRGGGGQGDGSRQGGRRRGGFGGGGFGGGGFGGGGIGGGGGFGGGGQRTQDSSDDRNRLQELTDEVKNPSPTLLVSQQGSDLTITDARDHTRVFQIGGKKDVHQLNSGTVESQTKWDGKTLVTEYDLGKGRKLRYTYSMVANTQQLLEQITFDGGSARLAPIKRVYDKPPAKAQ